MGKLLSSAIKMQNGGAVATATLQLEKVDISSMTWTKNGVSQGEVIGYQVFTLNAGDTFSATGLDFAGASLYYFFNGTFTTAYFDVPSVSTITYTAVAGNTYLIQGYAGA